MANQIVAGELYESITGQLFEIGRQLRQKNGYPYDPQALKITLQNAIEGCFSKKPFTLYLHDKQKNDGWINGSNLEKHLEETKLIDRCFSLEDELVKGWIANPSTYPEEFKDKAIFLWKSKRSSGGYTHVAYLYWRDDCVLVSWYWLERWWGGDHPALLASS